MGNFQPRLRDRRLTERPSVREGCGFARECSAEPHSVGADETGAAPDTAPSNERSKSIVHSPTKWERTLATMRKRGQNRM